MDNAIEATLLDFETTMKRFHTKRWEKKIAPQLEGLGDDERAQKLFDIMEQLQKEDPEFMAKVNNQMGRYWMDAILLSES